LPGRLCLDGFRKVSDGEDMMVRGILQVSHVRKLDLDKILERLIGHKVVLHYTQHEEPEMRETSGILRAYSKDMIHMTLYNIYGQPTEWYLNRHACTLVSITDEGKAER